MPIASFYARFKEPIKDGSKRHTMRIRRKNPIHAGHKLSLWIASRNANSKHREHLGWSVVKKVEPVEIEIRSQKSGKLVCELENPETHTVYPLLRLAGETFDPWRRSASLDRIDEFAKADGFVNWLDLLQWLMKVHGIAPLKADLIHWHYPLITLAQAEAIPGYELTKSDWELVKHMNALGARSIGFGATWAEMILPPDAPPNLGKSMDRLRNHYSRTYADYESYSEHSKKFDTYYLTTLGQQAHAYRSGNFDRWPF